MSLHIAACALLGAAGSADAGSAGVGSAAAAPFAFQKGDHVCLLGNGLAEGMQHDGWFEMLLQERLPALELSVRDLGFAGDELSVHQRTAGYGSWDEHLTRCQATVVLAFFGYNESFRDDAGLAKFRDDLNAFVDHELAARYDGAHAPRLVLLSSIPQEDLHDPLLPDSHEHNARIGKYRTATMQVADERHVPFVDLFVPMAARYHSARGAARGATASRSDHFTVDGIHLNERGDRALAEVLVEALAGARGEGADRAAANPLDDAKRETLRRAVLGKDLLWFNRYQATDGYNVYGGRSSLAYTDGVTNFDVLQRELVILDAMCVNRDRQIWALARGDDPAKCPIDDSNLPKPIAVKTNIPGPKPDGSHEFIDGTSAIALMTTPPGMKVELFADEQRFPDLAKPVQMAFDTKGRLRVAAWPTYPHWAPGEAMRDKLLILEDLDHDGRADVCKTFAGDLRNPTGFEFWNDGVIVADAPDLLFLKDTDGDDVADVRERWLSNLSSADTHHTANSFVFGPDGALYFQEGTFHQTQIESIYGPERNHDACVWRFEPRTFRVERHIAYDFANPHGHVFDRWGQEFVTDGTGNDNYYALPFSGRLVFPQKHSPYFTFFQQRSRPCAGSEILSSRHFPPENQGNLLLCNVIGFQGIFQYHITDDGSGFAAKEVEPLVYSSDPRFRPSDVEVGPDGAVYFLDWYNPIIGHMQHHLRDPNRDHEHGRVYRIRCEGRPLLDLTPIAGQPIAALLDLLKEPEDRVRYRARLELSARNSAEVINAVNDWVAHLAPLDPDREHHRLEALWLEEQHGAVDRDLLETLLRAGDPRVRAAAVRVLRFERRSIDGALDRLVGCARDPNPRVRLEAVVAASCFDDLHAVDVVLAALRKPTDRFLDYALSETMRTLEPFWRPALATLPLRDNPGAVAFLVDRVSDDELGQLPRIEPVLAALLARHGLSADQRRSVAAELARQRGTRVVDELVRAMREADASTGAHARHVQEALGELLVEAVATEPPDRPILVELASGARLPETESYARAACIVVDGGLDRAWTEALASERGPLAALEAVAPLRGPLADRAFEKVRPLMFRGADDPTTGPLAGFLCSYYPLRLRTAAREGFDALRPSAVTVADHVGVDVLPSTKSDAFALRFEARLTIETAGDYAFHLASDDGSRLYVDRQLVVDDDLDHGMVEVTGRCRLAAGEHALDLCYFDQGGYEGLGLLWSGPGFERQPVPLARVAPDLRASLRNAAARTIAALPGHETEKLADGVALLQDGAAAGAAVELIRSIPASTWGTLDARPALDAITAFARRIEVGERLSPDAIGAIDLGRGLIAFVPPAEQGERRRELRELGGATVRIATVPHQMLYDRREFTVAAGGPVTILFQNNDLMPHNLVVAAPGSLETVGTAAEAIALDPTAQARSFIPDLPAVMHSVRLLLPGESATLSFVAPDAKGDYPYVCTFPGHWRVMNGVMHVVAQLDDSAETANAAAPRPIASAIVAGAPAAESRTFVRMWTLEELAPAMAGDWAAARSIERGRTAFSQAGCVKCHWFRGDGVRSAPDLSEVRKKYHDSELLKQVLEPSAAILEGYEGWVFLRKDGSDVIGRIVKEDADGWQVAPNLQQPDQVELVKRSELQTMKKSKLSLMPTGLLVTFTKDEILDLVAFLQSEPVASRRADGG